MATAYTSVRELAVWYEQVAKADTLLDPSYSAQTISLFATHSAIASEPSKLGHLISALAPTTSAATTDSSYVPPSRVCRKMREWLRAQSPSLRFAKPANTPPSDVLCP